LEESKKKFSELQEEASKKEGQFLHLRVELEKIEKDMTDNIERKQFFEILTLKMKDHEERRLRLVEFLKHSKGIEENIQKLEERISGRNLLELEEKLKLLIGKEKEAETRISSFDQLIREKQLRIEEYEKKLGEVEKQKEEIKKFDILIKDLNIFEKALEQTQIELRSNFVEAVNYTMNNLWPTLYPYQDFVGVQLSIDEGDYVLQLKERNGRLINADGIASGGERTLACLTLRIAFSLVLAPHMRMLILDEPTANLDSRAVMELATTLRERINEFIDQTFLITHQNELEDAVTGNAYRIEREKSKDGVTKVISLN
jgi:DNA repair exonuclease SbcCD ATPase subunit